MGGWPSSQPHHTTAKTKLSAWSDSQSIRFASIFLSKTERKSTFITSRYFFYINLCKIYKISTPDAITLLSGGNLRPLGSSAVWKSGQTRGWRGQQGGLNEQHSSASVSAMARRRSRFVPLALPSWGLRARWITLSPHSRSEPLLCCPAITANEAVKCVMCHLEHPVEFRTSSICFFTLNDLFFNDILSKTGINPELQTDRRFCLHALALRYIAE